MSTFIRLSNNDQGTIPTRRDGVETVLVVFPFLVTDRGHLHRSSSGGVGRRIERSTRFLSLMLLANDRLVLGIGPVSQGLCNEADKSEEESEEDKSFGSMLKRNLDTERSVEKDVAIVVALGGEDECRQPQVRKHHINDSHPLAEHGGFERRQESRDKEDNRNDRNDEVVNDVNTALLTVHKVGVDTH